MQTYVINTSENRVFDSNLLFELVGYNKISWLDSGLDRVEMCAKSIIEKQSAPMADDCRVVVLVDFYSFKKTLHPDREAASDYVAIYKNFIEIYLLDHLFDPLRHARVGLDTCEVFYIQYVEQATHRYNDAEKEQVAHLLKLDDECRRLRIERHNEKVKYEEQHQTAASVKTEAAKKKASKEVVDMGEEKRYSVFTIEYENGVLEFPAESFYQNDYDDDDIDELGIIDPNAPENQMVNGKVTFNKFYQGYRTRSAQPRKYGVMTRTYLASGAVASRAAFDNLNLSLSLIRIYEREDSLPHSEAQNEVIPRVNKTVFRNTLVTAYAKIDAALAAARENGGQNAFFALEPPEEPAAFVGDMAEEEALDEDTSEEEKTGLYPGDTARGKKKFEEQYLTIRSFASNEKGEKTPAQQKAFDKLMERYKRTRDASREGTAKEENKQELLKRAKKADRCPSLLDYKNAIEKREKSLRGLLKTALSAEMGSADYTPEIARADKAYDKYKAAEACMTKNIVGDTVFLVLTLLAMLIPYAILQCADNPFSIPSLMMYGIAAAVFGGIFLFSFFLHFLPHLRRMDKAKLQMDMVYKDCVKKQKKAFEQLRRRYEKELPEIEKIRYQMRVINYLHAANAEKNRHAEAHREMLERVRDVLHGMMSSMQIAPDPGLEVSVDGEFNINKPFSANKVYKIFSIDVIDEMFKNQSKEYRE